MYSDGTHIYRAVPRLNLTATEIQPLCCGKLNIFQHLVDNVSPHETRHGKPNASPEAKAENVPRCIILNTFFSMTNLISITK